MFSGDYVKDQETQSEREAVLFNQPYIYQTGNEGRCLLEVPLNTYNIQARLYILL